VIASKIDSEENPETNASAIDVVGLAGVIKAYAVIAMNGAETNWSI
jgi:hypothetical protein